jgi:ABC-2 type transport system permease protein
VGKTQQIIERRVDELRQNMFVIHQLVIRDKKRSLSSTFMGELWEVINPLINMVVMVLVFSEMFGNDSSRKFPLYVLIGTTMYNLFVSGTTTSLNSLMENENFLIKARLSKNVYVVQKVLVAFRNFLFSLMILAFAIAVYRIQPNIKWLLFSLDILLMLFMMTGIGKILAIINVLFADITYFYKIFTLFLMYGSAIFYRVDRLSITMQKAMILFNPLYTVITIARKCIMDNMYPSWKLWAVESFYAVGFYLVGTIFFDKEIDNIVAKM